MLRKTEKFMRISIKKDEKELLFDLKQKKCHRPSKVLESRETNAFKQISQQRKNHIGRKNEENITYDKEIAKALNDFFSKIIKTLNIFQTNHSDTNLKHAKDSTLKAILKYRNHPIILGIKENTKSGSVFSHITKEDVMKEIKDLDI